MFSILVVEDNADMRELFCTVLTDGGYRAIPAADGQEALEVMEPCTEPRLEPCLEPCTEPVAEDQT